MGHVLYSIVSLCLMECYTVISVLKVALDPVNLATCFTDVKFPYPLICFEFKDEAKETYQSCEVM